MTATPDGAPGRVRAESEGWFHRLVVDVEVLRVFVGADGRGGNPLGVVYDGSRVGGRNQRQHLAASLGFSETVFVDDPDHGAVDIYTPSRRLDFAGYPLVGAAWLLRSRGHAVTVLRPPVGEVSTWAAGSFTWIRARAHWASGRCTQQFPTVAEVDALPVPPPGEGWLYAWAWHDETAARVRARGFPRRGDGIAEDEATGAAAVVLTARVMRSLDIHQGSASQIRTRFHSADAIDVGGRVRPAAEHVGRARSRDNGS
jgi:predicted PhzF superfamily epimerase YddE/YHI9